MGTFKTKYMKKIFFLLYGIVLLQHLLTQTYTALVISALFLGALFAWVSHKKHFGGWTPLFLLLHMSIEIRAHLGHHHGPHELLGHGIHAIFDLILLWTLTGTIKKYITWIGGVLITIVLLQGVQLETIVPLEAIDGFVLGGILGCIIYHTRGILRPAH